MDRGDGSSGAGTARGGASRAGVDRPAADGGPTPAVLSALDPQQREAVLATRGPLCILAGAGTGKTRTITHRIAYAVHTGQVPPGQLLAVTFTVRAAGEMRTRLAALGVGGIQARTFHAAALRQIRYFAPRVLGAAAPDLVENKIRLVAQAATRAGVRDGDRTLLRDLAAEIEWAKVNLTGPDGYPDQAARAGRVPPLDVPTTVAVLAAYEQVKTQAGVLDFEDLLLVTAAAIEQHRDVAEEVRARYRHFVVDEYQDVSPLQQRLLDAWLGGRDDICVVGDPNQTIYSFTGATPSYLLDFARRHPGAAVVRLQRDYRSTPQVVGLANRVLGRRSTLRLAGGRRPGPEPTFAEYDDEPAEAAAVAAACRRLIRGGLAASEIAVLFRVNAQSEAYERALTEAGIPYVLRGGERFFQRPEIRQAMVLLRGATVGDRLSAGGAGPSATGGGAVRSAGSVAVAGAGTMPEAVRDVLSSVGWNAAAPPGGGAARARWESLAALVGVAEELAAGRPSTGGAGTSAAGGAAAASDAGGRAVAAATGGETGRSGTVGLADLVAELDQRAAAQHAPTVQGVTLASLHAAKGLEWDAVFLVGLVEGTLPIQHAGTDAQVEEERRLLYVGVTRARERLALSWSLSRTPGGRRNRRRSRFLQGLAPAPGEPARQGLPAEPERLAEPAQRQWPAAAADAKPPTVAQKDSRVGGIADGRQNALRLR